MGSSESTLDFNRSYSSSGFSCACILSLLNGFDFLNAMAVEEALTQQFCDSLGGAHIVIHLLGNCNMSTLRGNRRLSSSLPMNGGRTW